MIEVVKPPVFGELAGLEEQIKEQGRYQFRASGRMGEMREDGRSLNLKGEKGRVDASMSHVIFGL